MHHKLLLFLLFLALFAPNFPSLLGTEVYLYFLFGIFGTISLAVRQAGISKGEIALVVFYFLMQLFLLFGWSVDIFEGGAAIGDVGSAFRPVILALLPLLFVHLFIGSDWSPEHILDVFFSTSLLALSFYLIGDFFGVFDSFKYLLWERREKFEQYNYFLSFFATSYFAAYFYFMAYCYAVVSLFYERKKLKWVVLSVLGFVLVVFAQSKIYYVLIVLVPFVVAFFKVGVFFRVTIVVAFFLSVVVVHLYLPIVISAIESLGLRGFRSFASLIGAFSDHGSVVVRMEQIRYALVSSFQLYGMSAGLGRDLMLESYISAFVFRYGFVGFVFYNIFFLVVSFFCLKEFLRVRSKKNGKLFLYGFVWYSMLPISLLSSPMNEMGKGAIFTSMVLAAIIIKFRYIRMVNKELHEKREISRNVSVS